MLWSLSDKQFDCGQTCGQPHPLTRLCTCPFVICSLNLYTRHLGQCALTSCCCYWQLVVITWCHPVTMSPCCYVTLLPCHYMLLCQDVTWCHPFGMSPIVTFFGCHLLSPCHDVTWCHPVMISPGVTLPGCHLVSPCYDVTWCHPVRTVALSKDYVDVSHLQDYVCIVKDSVCVCLVGSLV